MDLLTIFQTLYKRRLLLIGIPLLAAIAAFFFTSGYKKTYKSTAQLATGFTISEEVKITDERFNLYEADVKFENLIETINSPRVLSLLSYRLLIHDLTSPNLAFRDIQEKVSESPELMAINRDSVRHLLTNRLDSMNILVSYVDKDREAINLLEAYEYDVESLKESVNVSRINRTDYVSVISYSEDPYLSSFMVNILCEEFLRYNSSINSSRSNEYVRVFSQLVAQKKKELDDKAEQLRLYKSSNSLLNFSAETESKISQITELELKREDERRNLRSITLNLTDINDKITKVQGAESSSVNTDIVELRKKISLLNQQYIAGGSNNSELANTIQEARTTLRNLMARANQTPSASEDLDYLLNKKNELEIEKKLSEQNLSAIENKLFQLNRNAGGYASQEAQISALERDLNLASEEYKNAQEKYNKSLDIALASGSSIRQILVGQPASDPEPSKRLIITGLSGVSSFLLCILIVILLEYVDVSIKSSSNFTSLIPIKLVGSLNHVNLKKSTVFNLFKIPREKLDSKSNLFRESLRKLRFELEKLDHQVYLITSTKQKEGKTTVLSALGMALSFSGSRILFIDMNFSNNSLTREFKASPSLEYLLTKKNVDINSSISKTEVPEIDIIGCQGGNYSPIEIFKPERLQCLINSLKERYDYIFLEGAALNFYSDSRELSQYVQGVITVFSANSTIKQTDKESIAFIKTLDCKNIGGVLNNVEVENMDT
uniref:Wzz/FepE/Etk N-terminal domain-containing protein n=1 Tax=Roseihalotalea indica TaxID=2867963 RepID=A0AA49JD60_9BACT|nr:Wzz/FepE/Etk N-terminal domain-containing protein [Tunicatimonas sp. TK19036]